MPPTTLDLIRAKIVRLLSDAQVREHGSAHLVAEDDGRVVRAKFGGRWYRLTIEEDTES